MVLNFVLLLILNTHNEVLLLRRINTPFCCGSYCLPGGQIKYGESAQQTAVREMQNTFGQTIELADIQFKHIMYRKCHESEFFSCIFQVSLPQGDIQNIDQKRYDDMQWFSVDNLPENMVSAHRYTIQQIQHNVIYSEHGWHAQ